MKQNIFLTKLLPYRNHILYFLICWFLLGLYYSDVLYIAQQNSFFTTEGILMKFVTDHYPYGYLWWLGRAALQLFYYPVIGSAVTALMFTLNSGLFAYVFRLKGKMILLQFLPTTVWLGYIFYQGYDNYYQAETGKILGIPLCILIILVLQSLFMRTFSKKPILSFFRTGESSRKQSIWESVILVLIPCLLVAWNETYRPYVRPTAHMQKALQKEDWEEMKETAKECGVSARPIAAYYAIALLQTGQITQSLFDLEYNYADLHLHDRNNDKDFGTAYYEADGNFYAGLTNTAYRNAMERLTMDGPSALILKILTESALLNGETEVCKKYLDILKCLPFEGAFVEHIEMFLDDPTLIEKKQRYANILKLRPVNDSFETLYREPLFLGYNIALLQGRSLDALQASLAACLYSKLMPDFLVRTEPLVNTSPLPQNVQDALIMESYKNNRIEQVFQFDAFTKQKYALFMQLAGPYKQNREEGAQKLKEQFLGFYPYYYHFGNVKAEAAPENEQKKQTEQRVN